LLINGSNCNSITFSIRVAKKINKQSKLNRTEQFIYINTNNTTIVNLALGTQTEGTICELRDEGVERDKVI